MRGGFESVARQTKLHGCAKFESELDGLQPENNMYFEIE